MTKQASAMTFTSFSRLLALLIASGASEVRATPTAVSPTDAPPAVHRAEEGASLKPPGEDDAMARRPVALDRMAFEPGKGLSVASMDGDFSMKLGLRAQFLYSRTTGSVDQGEETQSFQVRRLRVTFAGNTFAPHIRYKLELAVSPRDENLANGVVTTTPLLDAYVDFEQLRDLRLRVGQYKVPFSRQRVISSGALQFVDRSVANAEFNLDRDIGMDLHSDDLLGLDMLRYYAGLYVGNGRNSFEPEATWDVFYLARLEILPWGVLQDYVEADFERTGPRLSLGAAIAHLDDSPNERGVLGGAPSDGGSTDFYIFEADAMLKLWGLSIFSEVFYRNGKRKAGDAVNEDGVVEISPTRDGLGGTLQAGYLLPRLPLEVTARYSLVRGKDDPGEDGLRDLDEYTVALSWYLARHQLKLQGDYSRLVTEEEFAEGADLFRLQLQFAY